MSMTATCQWPSYSPSVEFQSFFILKVLPEPQCVKANRAPHFCCTMFFCNMLLTKFFFFMNSRELAEWKEAMKQKPWFPNPSIAGIVFSILFIIIAACLSFFLFLYTSDFRKEDPRETLTYKITLALIIINFILAIACFYI